MLEERTILRDALKKYIRPPKPIPTVRFNEFLVKHDISIWSDTGYPWPIMQARIAAAYRGVEEGATFRQDCCRGRALDSMQQNVILMFANLTRQTSSPKIIALQRACQFPRKIHHGCVLGSRIKAEESVLLCHHKVPKHGTPSTPFNQRFGHTCNILHYQPPHLIYYSKLTKRTVPVNFRIVSIC